VQNVSHGVISRFGHKESLICLPPTVFLGGGGCLKTRVFQTQPATLNGLKVRTREAIQAIPYEVLQRVMNYFATRLQKCIYKGNWPFITSCLKNEHYVHHT